jgi:hypothetical protein
MNEIHKMKLREASSSIAKSSIKPIFRRFSEQFIFLPSFMIFIQTVVLAIIYNSFPIGWRLPIYPIYDPVEQHRLEIRNFVIHIYLPIVLICSILISLGLLLNLNKRFVRFGNSTRISDEKISKRKIIVKERGERFQIQNDLRTVPYKPRFRLIYIPIAVFFFYTAILTSLTNGSGFNSETTFNFVIQQYIPIVLLCWSSFMVILMVTHLRRKLSGIKINNS